MVLVFPLRKRVHCV